MRKSDARWADRQRVLQTVSSACDGPYVTQTQDGRFGLHIGCELKAVTLTRHPGFADFSKFTEAQKATADWWRSLFQFPGTNSGPE